MGAFRVFPKKQQKSLPNAAQLKEQLGVNKTGRVQNFVTDDVFVRLIDYIPMKSGRLRASAEKTSPTKITVGGAGIPYARAQFFGVTKDGTPFDYNTAAGAKIGAHWDRRLVQNEGAQIVADANKYVKGLKHG
jgi:Minor capsid.